MREHMRIGLVLLVMTVIALLLVLTRGMGIDVVVRRVLIDLPLVAGLVTCFVYLIVLANRALRKAGLL